MRHLVGLPSYKNLGEALEGVLARHLAAQRKRQTETARATPILASPTPQSPNVLPKNVALSQAKREERLAQYQQVVAFRQLGFSQTAGDWTVTYFTQMEPSAWQSLLSAPWPIRTLRA